MVLQRYFGLSDREAVAAFEFDLRWRYACGGLAGDGGGFCHTVLAGMRARLAASAAPRRIFDAVLEALEGRELSVEVAQAAELLAAVVGQDLREDSGGRLVIARRVARDRIISVADPDARHGHKTAARGFDGYKGHIATDPTPG